MLLFNKLIGAKNGESRRSGTPQRKLYKMKCHTQMDNLTSHFPILGLSFLKPYSRCKIQWQIIIKAFKTCSKMIPKCLRINNIFSQCPSDRDGHLEMFLPLRHPFCWTYNYLHIVEPLAKQFFATAAVRFPELQNVINKRIKNACKWATEQDVASTWTRIAAQYWNSELLNPNPNQIPASQRRAWSSGRAGATQAAQAIGMKTN